MTVVPFKAGAHEQAAELLDAGPPFEPGEAGFDRHAVYLTDAEVVFVEGMDAEWLLDFLQRYDKVLPRWHDLKPPLLR